MTRFDGWETQLYGDVMALPTKDELMHFRTKGSKNGVRRYQTESGEWTPLGLKERKAREGWGQSRKERRAEKRVAKAERRVAKAEKRTTKIQARQQRMAAYKAKRNKKDLSGLSDEELRKRIERVKMEQEYKELTRSPLLKNGEKLVTSILEAKARAADRADAKAKMELDNRRVTADIIKAKENTKRAQADADKARQERKKAKQDRKAGLAYERAAELQKAKTAYRETTLRGGIVRRLNTKMNAGLKEKYTAKRKAEGEAIANRVKSDASRDLKKRKTEQLQKDLRPYEKEQERLRKQRNKNRKAYEKEMKKIKSWG